MVPVQQMLFLVPSSSAYGISCTRISVHKVAVEIQACLCVVAAASRKTIKYSYGEGKVVV